MKFFKVSKILIFTFLLIVTGSAIYGENITEVKFIKFRGLKNLSKYQVISNVKTRGIKNGIIIDLDSLEKALKGNKLIEEFKVVEDNKKLIITIKEKEILMAMAMRKGKSIIPFEVDNNFNIISTNTIHLTNSPLIIINRGGFINGQLSGKVKNVCLRVKLIKSEYPLLYDELSEIYYINENFIKVKLFGRKTKFLLKPEIENFIKLNYMVGYLDSIRYYPDEVSIIGDAAIISR